MLRTGYLLKLDSSSWDKIEKRARNAIRKAEKHLKVRPGTLEELRSLHFDPVYLPSKKKDDQLIFVATYGNKVTAAILVTLKTKERKIIYTFAGSDSNYKQYNGNSLLVWHILQLFEDSDYIEFDLGGSGKPGIDRFKRQFATDEYHYKPKRDTFRGMIKRVKIRVKRMLMGGLK